MAFPVQHALLYPVKVPSVDPPIDFTRLVSLEFGPVDEVRFPMLRLAREAMHACGAAPAILNAANEVAVAAFLGEKIPFLAISAVVEQTLARCSNFEPPDLPSLLAADAEARRVAADEVLKLGAHP
jgi:1-deoxy-D-xylulose-5-phosphate reductoisomerase